MNGFQPLPLLGNPHLQTILGSLLPAPRVPFSREEHVLALPDGDSLVLQESVPPEWQPDGKLVVLVHGMGGTHASGYMCRVARALVLRGVRVGRLDLRGCGRGAALARRSYNAACSADVRVALACLAARHPQARLALVGFSLGGNIVLRLAGELAEHPVPRLTGVAALAPPVDLELCSELISQPRNRLYELFFLRALVRQVRCQERHHPELSPVPFPKRGLTLRRFDDLYTAPRGGFAGVADYYRRASSLPLLASIPVPTLILTARDDPFVAVRPLEQARLAPHVEMCITAHGGHLGYLGRDGAGGVRWAERKLIEWLCRLP